MLVILFTHKAIFGARRVKEVSGSALIIAARENKLCSTPTINTSVNVPPTRFNVALLVVHYDPIANGNPIDLRFITATAALHAGLWATGWRAACIDDVKSISAPHECMKLGGLNPITIAGICCKIVLAFGVALRNGNTSFAGMKNQGRRYLRRLIRCKY